MTKQATKNGKPYDPDTGDTSGVGLPPNDEVGDDVDADETGRDLPLSERPLIELVTLPLRKDLKDVAESLTVPQVRFVVDNYYTWQANRIAAHNQAAALTRTSEPHLALDYVEAAFAKFEDDMKAMLDAYTRTQHMGIWARSIMGVGPVLAAGLIAHLDVTRAPTVGHFWRFAGLDPTVRWLGTKGAADLVERGQAELNVNHVTAELMAWLAKETNRRHEVIEKMCTDPKTGKYSVAYAKRALARRPWNAALKVLAWKLGESFVKVQNYERDYYGKKIAQRKLYEQGKNEAGEYSDQARQKLLDFRIGKETDAYLYYAGCVTPSQAREVAAKPPASRQAALRAIAGEEGSGIPMLPPGHIHARSKRWAVKLFFSHWHGEAYRDHYKQEPPAPYPIAYLGHAHYMPAPVV